MKYKVILADGEKEMLDNIKRTLVREAYDFEVVGTFLDGRDVMKFLKHHEADLILTNIHLPHIDGVELAKKIREQYSYIKVFIYSEYENIQYVKEAKAQGVADYIIKSVAQEQVTELLNDIRESLVPKREKALLQGQWDEHSLRQNVTLVDEKSRNQLFTAVKNGKETKIFEIVDQMRRSVNRQNLNGSNGQAYCVSLLNALLVFQQQNELNMRNILGYCPDYVKILEQYDETDDFLIWFEDACLRISRYMVREGENKAKDLVKVAVNYMWQEYANPEISLERVADEVGVTPTYFSYLFKKETGENFVEHLTNIRMEEAMRMVRETEDKIYVVGQKAGYSEPGYFSHVFKKKYGISPIQCRQQSR